MIYNTVWIKHSPLLFLVFMAACNMASLPERDVIDLLKERDYKGLAHAIRQGTDIEKPNSRKQTPLLVAVWNDDLEAVRMLVEAGVDINHVNRLGWTALLEAVLLSDGGKTHQQIVEILLKAGADREIPDFEGRTALDHARAKGFREMVNLLESTHPEK